MDADRQIIVFDEENYKLLSIENVKDIKFNTTEELCAVYTDTLTCVCGYAKKWLSK